MRALRPREQVRLQDFALEFALCKANIFAPPAARAFSVFCLILSIDICGWLKNARGNL